MKSPARAQRMYQPLQAKTFTHIFARWLAEEFPHLGGPKVRALFVDEVIQLVDTHLLTAAHLEPGQVVWYAVDKTDLPREHHRMAETRLVPVVLTLVTPPDLQQLAHGAPIPQVRQTVVARLLREAEAQGGVLAETDLACLTCVSPSIIGAAVRAYEQEQQCILPRRGTVHDLGPSVSHKAVIARKAYLEAKHAPQIAWETNHSLKATERYLVDLMRVYISLHRRDSTVAETAFTTGLSQSLVQEYAALIAELGLTDEALPAIIAELVGTVTAPTRPESATQTPGPAGASY